MPRKPGTEHRPARYTLAAQEAQSAFAIMWVRGGRR